MTTPPDEPPTITQTGTCHTAGCVNEGIAITMDAAENAPWLCGGCEQPITDVTTT